MNLYKVTFNNNEAIAAELLKMPHHDSLKFDSTEGKRLIKWITIYAETENESMSIANRVVEAYFDFLHA